MGFHLIFFFSHLTFKSSKKPNQVGVTPQLWQAISSSGPQLLHLQNGAVVLMLSLLTLMWLNPLVGES